MFWTEELSKRVEVYSKNKIEKLVHMVGFIIRIYHDAWSPEHQKKCLLDVTLIFYTVRISILNHLI